MARISIGETFRVLTKSPSFGGMEKEMKAYGDAAQSDEKARVGEVGSIFFSGCCTQRINGWRARLGARQ